MYEELFQLNRRPFSATPDPACFFECDSNLVVIEELLDCVERCKGISVLTAAPGMGKTLICQRLASILSSQYETIFLGNGKFPSCRALLQAIMFEMGVEYSRKDEDEIRLELRAALNILRPEKEALVIIVDEAHLHQPELLEELRTLSDVAEDGRPLVRLILAGQIEFEEQLGGREMSAINQRIGAQLCLLPFSHTESLNYMHHRMEWAGGHADTALTPQAQNLISRASGGVPRCLNQLADHTLLLSFAANDVPASEDRVREALEDLKQLPLHWNDINDTIGELPANDFDSIDDFSEEETVFSESANDAVVIDHQQSTLGQDEIESDELPAESSTFEFGGEQDEVAPTENNQRGSSIAGLVLDLFSRDVAEETPSSETPSSQAKFEESDLADVDESNEVDAETPTQTAFFEFGGDENNREIEDHAPQEAAETSKTIAVEAEEESLESRNSTVANNVSFEHPIVANTIAEDSPVDQGAFETIVVNNPSIRLQEPDAQEVVWNLPAFPATSSELATPSSVEEIVNETPTTELATHNVDAESAETESAETESVETESAETESAETESAETESAETESAETESAETESVETEDEQPSDFAVGEFDDNLNNNESKPDESLPSAEPDVEPDVVETHTKQEVASDQSLESEPDHTGERELAGSTHAELNPDRAQSQPEETEQSETHSENLDRESIEQEASKRVEFESDEPVIEGAPSVAELARAFGIVNLDDSPTIEASHASDQASSALEAAAESASTQSDETPTIETESLVESAEHTAETETCEESDSDQELIGESVAENDYTEAEAGHSELTIVANDGDSEDAFSLQFEDSQQSDDQPAHGELESQAIEETEDVEDCSDDQLLTEQLNALADSVEESLGDSATVVPFQEFHQQHDTDPELHVVSDNLSVNDETESDVAAGSEELDSVYGLQESDFTTNSEDNAVEAEAADDGIRDIRPDRYLDAIGPMLDELNQDGMSHGSPSGNQLGHDIERELVESVSHNSSDIEDEIGASVLDMCLDAQWTIQNGSNQGDDDLEEEEEREFDPADFDIVEPEMEEPPTSPSSTPSPEPITGESQETSPRRRRPLGSLFSDLRRRRDSQ